MATWLILFYLTAALFGAFAIGYRSSKRKKTAGLPRFYGWCAVVWYGFAALGALWLIQNILTNNTLPTIFAVLVGLLFLTYFLFKIAISGTFKAREHLEKWIKLVLLLAATASIAITFLIVLSMIGESYRFFEKVPFTSFLFGTEWSPQTALRSDQAGSSGSFGILPLLAGTLLITFIAMTIATPLAIFSATYLSEYCSNKTRNRIKPLLEILAGIPTVVYGYFAVITIAPFIRGMGESWGLSISSESALATGLVMGIMIVPFVLSLTDDAIHSVPGALRDASLALGSTPSESMRKVILPTALPAIISAILLGISRAIGETMIVVMAAGLAANLTINPLESVTTVTVQIVTLLVGDQEFDSAKTLAAFALGLTLFLVTLTLNIISNIISKKYERSL